MADQSRDFLNEIMNFVKKCPFSVSVKHSELSTDTVQAGFLDNNYFSASCLSNELSKVSWLLNVVYMVHKERDNNN